jgi:hypothetical protein
LPLFGSAASSTEHVGYAGNASSSVLFPKIGHQYLIISEY